MRALRYKAEVGRDGRIELLRVGFEPGTHVEVIVLEDNSWENDNPGLFTALVSQHAFAQVWDTPEEDEAWKDLQ